MPKRSAGEPGTSSARTDREHDSNTDLQLESQQSPFQEPAPKRIDREIKEEPTDNVEQSGALTFPEAPANIKLEPDVVDEEEEEEDDEDENSRSPIAAMEDEEEDDEDADSVIDRSDTTTPSAFFIDCCTKANLTGDTIVAAWDMYYYAAQRVSLEGSEAAWQLAALYYYLLSKGIKRRGKPSRLLMQPFPTSILTIANIFDVSVTELFDKTTRFAEIIQSRKMRRYLEYFRRIQEGLAVSSVVFKKFCKVYRGIFEIVREGSENCPSSHELFTILWTSFLVLKSRLPTDDLINNYQLLFSLIDHFYTEISSMQDGIVYHLDQNFVASLIENDCTILRSLCTNFGGSVLETRHFFDHTYKKMEKTGLPSTWDFVEYRDIITSAPKEAYDQILLQRGGIDERIFVPTKENFLAVFSDDFKTADILKFSRSGKQFVDAELLNTISNNHCLEKISHGKGGQEKLSQAREQPKVPCVEYNLELGKYPEDEESNQAHERLTRILYGWKMDSSKLKSVCEQMNDSPTVTILLKCDELCSKFEKQLTEEYDSTGQSTVLDRYHKGLRKEVETAFLMYLEKIVLAELKKKVREEDLVNVLRREEFLDSVFCFCVELVLFSNGYDREFPWSAELCGCHPFMFHKVIDLMISHEKRLSRQMVQHFSKIEESVIDYYAWKRDSPMWPLVVRCPFSHFQEFGDDWADKLNSYSPMKFTPVKKADELRDELGRPVAPQNQTSRTLRIFLKRVYFTAARRLQDLTDRISMANRGKSQCWSLFDYLLRNDTLVFMDRHIDHIILCCVYVIMKITETPVTFHEIMGQYRRQSSKALHVYRNVSVFEDQLNAENPMKVNTKETIMERLEAPPRALTTVDVIQYYNIEFRDRIKFIVGQIDTAADEDLMEMPVPTSHGLAPVRVYLTQNVSIQMLPKTQHKGTDQEMAIAHLEKNGRSLEEVLGHANE